MELAFLILLSMVLLIFGISSFISNRKSKTNILFLLFILCLIVWITSNYLSNTLLSYDLVILFNRLIFISTSLLVWLLFLFASVYPNSKESLNKLWYLISTIFTFVVLIVDISNYVVKSVVIENSYSSIEFGNGIYLYLLHFVLFFLLFIFLLIRKYKGSSGLEKIQLQYLLLGIVVSAIGAMVTNLLLPIVFKIFSLSNYGPGFLVIFIGFTFFSIVKHRFLGIRFLLGKIIFYICLSLFLFLFFFGFALIGTTFFDSIFSGNTILLSVIVFPIFAWLMLKFIEKIRKLIEENFVYEKIHPQEMLSKFLKRTSTELDMDKIAVYVINTVKKYLGLGSIGILLFDKESSQIIYKRLLNFKLEGVRDLLQVIHYWKDIGSDPVLVLEEVKKVKEMNDTDPKGRLGRIIGCMEKEEISAILPLNRKVQLNGIIIIGKKKNGDPLSVEDIDFLESIIANASVAMGRAILYKEVASFNQTLSKKVEEQTRELKKKVLQLNEARRKEHDMIDIMGHELRTPMTVIRNYYELLNNLFKKEELLPQKKSIKTQLNGYMEVIEENIEREIDLINVLLSATKLDDGKLELNRESVNIIDIIRNSIIAYEKEVKEKGVYLKMSLVDGKKELPRVFADKVRIQEVVDNLISNAVKYTNKGGVDIFVSIENEYMRVEIKDTGIGMSEEDLKNIGRKFYRSNQYIEGVAKSIPLVRPGGTGLGLFVTFGLIRAHGGRIEVKSKMGEGSSFIFTIPLLKENDTKGIKQKKVEDMFVRLGLKK